MELWAGLVALCFVVGCLLGWHRERPVAPLRLAIILAVVTLLGVVAGLWLEDQGGLVWFLLMPLELAGAVVAALVVGNLGYAAAIVLRHRRLFTWKLASPFVVYALLGVAIWAATAVAPLVARTSERAMLANFARHEAQFRRLAEMAAEDERFTRIAPEFTSPTLLPGQPAAAEIPLPAERWEEYRALFRTTDLRNGVTNRGAGIVWFDYWATGILDSGRYQGYAYSREPLTPVVDSIDVARRSGDIRQPVYQPIREGWYLYYWE